MWVYSQSTGLLWDERKLIVSEGYSGYEQGKNAPKFEAIASVGPIPRGLYVIGHPYHSQKVGPVALPLTPSRHKAHGRTDFLIHGDSASHPGQASKGCIIMNRSVRIRIQESNDKILEVIE